jgi:hypothetical protein
MADDEVQVKFGADISELKSSMDQVSADVKTALDAVAAALDKMADQSKQAAKDVVDSNQAIAGSLSSLQSNVTGIFSSIAGSLNTLREGFVVLAGVLAGGALFKSSIDAVVDWGSEVGKLSQRLGVSTQSASGLAMSLKIVGMSSDQYLALTQRLERQVKTNADMMEHLGIVLKDPVTGNAKDLVDVMEQCRAKIAEYAEGGNQAQMAMALMGGRVGDLGKFLRLNNDMMEEGAKKAQELGMVLSKDGVQAVHQYEEELHKFQASWQAVEMHLGKAIMPLLQKLASWLNTEGPAAVEIFIGVLKSLAEGLADIVAAGQKVMVVWEALPKVGRAAAETFNKAIADASDTFAPGAGMALFGSDAYSKAKTGFSGLADSVKGDLAAIDSKLAATKAKIAETFAKPAGGAPGGAGASYTPPGKQTADVDIAAAGAANQAASGAASGAQNIVAQYQEELQRIKDSQQNLNAWSAEKDYEFWNTKLATTRKGSDEWWQIVHHMADDLRTLTAEQKAELDKQAKQEDAAMKQIAAMKKIDDESIVKMDKEKYDTQYALGQISASQRAQLEKQSINKEYADLIESYNAELAELQKHGADTLKEQQKVWLQLEKAKADHDQKMQKSEDQALVAMQKQWDNYATQVGNALTQMLFKHQTFLQTVQNLTERMTSYVIDLALKEAAHWILNELKKTSATEGGVAARTASEAAGAAAGFLAQGVAMIKSIMASAAEAFAGVFGFLAPIMGPAAAGPAAAAQATVSAEASMIQAGFAGGGDVPFNMVARLHAREMVLPTPLADKVRGMTESAGGDLHLHINANDSKSFEDQLANSSSKLNQLMTQAFRNFHLRRR